jgi:hypothetical protein
MAYSLLGILAIKSDKIKTLYSALQIFLNGQNFFFAKTPNNCNCFDKK